MIVLLKASSAMHATQNRFGSHCAVGCICSDDAPGAPSA